MALTTTRIREIKPDTKTRKYADQNGLFLRVKPNGTKSFHHKYYHNKREKLLALGIFPATTLVQARDLHRHQREQLAQGVDPSLAKRTKGENTFEAVAQRWYDVNESRWVEPAAKRVRFRLAKDINPHIGHYPVADITPPVALQCLRQIEARGVGETVRRCKSIIGQVMRFGLAEGLCTDDPTVHLRGVLKPQPKPIHRPAVVTPQGAKGLHRTLTAARGNKAHRGVCITALLTLQRNTEIRRMRWADIDGDIWTNHITKTGIELQIPLPDPVLQILDEMRGWDDTWVFAGESREGNISVIAPLHYLRSLGYDTKTEVSLHGMRATGRTLLVQELSYPSGRQERLDG